MLSKALLATIALAMQSAYAVNLTLELESQVDATLDARQKTAVTNCSTATSMTQTGWFCSAAYLAKTKEDKLSDLWTMILSGGDNQTPSPYLWSDFEDLFTGRGNASFMASAGDEMPAGQKKVVHTQGVVAKIEWVPTPGTPYTGIFAEGSTNAIIRYSQTPNLTTAHSGLLPSLAIKFLIDGVGSQNIFAMPNFTGTSSWDFFSQSMTNRVAPFNPAVNPIEDATIRKKLTEGSKWPFVTGLGDAASITNDGKAVTAPNVPYQQRFTSSYHFSDAKEIDPITGKQVMFYDQLKRIKQGSIIMSVEALTAPVSFGGTWVKMADIKLLSDLYTSTFADSRLFFRHREIKTDLALWPARWRDLKEDPEYTETWGTTVPTGTLGWPTNNTDAEAKFTSQISTYGCPFAWLIGQN